MQKFQNAEIKNFEFTDLKGSPVVSNGNDFKTFSFGELTGQSIQREVISEETLRSERTFEKNTQFKIDDVVRDYRGLSRQEQSDLETRISEEVRRRLEASYEAAYQEGLEKGRVEGKAEAYAHHEQDLVKRVDEFVQILTDLKAQSETAIAVQKHEIYDFVKKFTKWIILKEVNEKVYLEGLFEKLLYELNARKNITVKVGKSSIEHMPEIIKAIEAKLGQLSNLRLEVVPEIQHPGIILESENGLIDGTIEGVFKNIDKIFEQVVKHD